MNETSTLIPTFLRKLQNPEIKNILIAGCGGGFDFVHGMLLYPELKRLGKNVVIASYSFTTPISIYEAPVVFSEGDSEVRKVNGSIPQDSFYAPEILLCQYLDQQFPKKKPHFIYALYARSFTVPDLSKFYSLLVKKHKIDCILLIDGGSDGLMKGDEAELGDPVEDATSLAAVASLAEVKDRIFITVGLGADRNTGVQDAATLRAIAEITKADGYLGSFSIEKNNINYKFYRNCVAYIFAHQKYQPGVVRQIMASVEGFFGNEENPYLQSRNDGTVLYNWPLMAMMWFFKVTVMAERSYMVDWLQDVGNRSVAYKRILEGRSKIEIRDCEKFPSKEDDPSLWSNSIAKNNEATNIIDD